MRHSLALLLCLLVPRAVHAAAVTVGSGAAGTTGPVVVSPAGTPVEPVVVQTSTAIAPAGISAPSSASVTPSEVVPSSSGGLSVPEPVTLAIFGTGLLLLFRKRSN